MKQMHTSALKAMLYGWNGLCVWECLLESDAYSVVYMYSMGMNV